MPRAGTIHRILTANALMIRADKNDAVRDFHLGINKTSRPPRIRPTRMGTNNGNGVPLGSRQWNERLERGIDLRRRLRIELPCYCGWTDHNLSLLATTDRLKCLIERVQIRLPRPGSIPQGHSTPDPIVRC